MTQQECRLCGAERHTVGKLGWVGWVGWVVGWVGGVGGGRSDGGA